MDWKQIISDLLNNGMTYVALSDSSGIPVATLAELKSGHTKDVKWQRGEVLLKLHDQHCATKAA